MTHRTESASGAVADGRDAQWPVGAARTAGHVSLDLGADDQVVTEEARGRSERFTEAWCSRGGRRSEGRTGSRRTTMPLEVGCLLMSATLSSGTWT